MLPWKSIVQLDTQLNRAIYLQIADSITNEIVNGRIKQGAKLPGSRVLAKQLDINRKTAQQAFDELIAQGWIEVLPARGTFVKRSLPTVNARKILNFSETPSTEEEKEVYYDHVINDGIPDYRLAPIESLYRTARSLTKGAIGKRLLTGNHLLGENTLRHTLVDYLSTTRAIQGSTSNILITRGSQMGIWLACTHLINNGEKVIVGEFNYSAANSTIERIGGSLRKVRVTAYGLDLDQVESIVKRSKIKAIYISPHHHYPTTVTMPAANRLRLMNMAEQYGFYVIEDDYDYDYHYSGSPILPLASIDHNHRVIYLGSFSKVLAPSIRIGYMHAGAEIIKSCASLRRQIDRRGDPIIERALAELIKENEIQRSLKKAVRHYHLRRDLFCDLLRQNLEHEIEFSIPEGGMAIWARFTNSTVAQVVKQCQKRGLLLEVDGYHDPFVCRLGFASQNETEIKENIDILKKCFIK